MAKHESDINGEMKSSMINKAAIKSDIKLNQDRLNE